MGGNRDHTIKVLQDEIAEQDKIINKLNKEKKHLSEAQAKSNEDLLAATDKVAHLAGIKDKLEGTLDELEGGLDKEKKSRANLEKAKRKVEGDLKLAQDNAADLERAKRELEAVIAAKEKNNLDLQAKLDDEQGLVAKNQKTVKELQGRVEALEEELEAERQARAKAEKQRSDLGREIDGLGDRYNEATGATAAQVELNKKREAEIARLRKDVEEANIQQESILGNLKRKQGDSAVDKANHNMLDQLNAINKKVDAASLTLGDYAASKNKISNENADLLRVIGDLENNLNILAKAKSALAAQL